MSAIRFGVEVATMVPTMGALTPSSSFRNRRIPVQCFRSVSHRKRIQSWRPPAGSVRDSATFGRRMLPFSSDSPSFSPTRPPGLSESSPTRNSAPSWFISLKFNRAFSSSSVAMKVKVNGCGSRVSVESGLEAQVAPGIVGLHEAEAHLAPAIGRGAEADRVDGALLDGQFRLVELHVPAGRARFADAEDGRAAFDRRIDRRALVLLDVPAFQLPGQAGVDEHLRGQRFVARAPGLGKRRRAGISLAEPFVPLFPEVAGKHVGQRIEAAAHPGVDQAVLVVDLDQRHRGIFGIGEFRVGIQVREQLPRVTLLRLQVRGVEEADGVRGLPVELVHLGIHAVADAEAAADKQVQVGVDPMLLQPGDEVIEAIERIGVPVPAVARLVIDQPGRAPRGIEKMEPHRVQAELGHPRGHLVGRRVVRKVGGGGEIHAEEPQAMVAAVEVAVLDVDET